LVEFRSASSEGSGRKKIDRKR